MRCGPRRKRLSRQPRRLSRRAIGVIKGKVVFAGKEPEAKIFKAIEDYKWAANRSAWLTAALRILRTVTRPGRSARTRAWPTSSCF